MTKHYFTSNGHVLLAGITGSDPKTGGKTALANWWASTHGLETFDLVVFFNAKGSSGVRGERVYSVDELAEGMAEGKRHFDFVPPTEDWASCHERLKQAMNALPTEMSKFVVHDETPDYCGEGSLSWFLKVGGQEDGVHAANCKSLVLAQDPVDLPTNIRKMCTTHVWIGPIGESYRSYFTNHNYLTHFEHIQEKHDPYWWTVMTGPGDDQRDLYRPVPEEFA